MDKNIEKKTLKADDRDFGADVVRIAAGIMVLTLHFFLRNGFYYRELTGFFGISADACRADPAIDPYGGYDGIGMSAV